MLVFIAYWEKMSPRDISRHFVHYGHGLWIKGNGKYWKKGEFPPLGEYSPVEIWNRTFTHRFPWGEESGQINLVLKKGFLSHSADCQSLHISWNIPPSFNRHSGWRRVKGLESNSQRPPYSEHLLISKRAPEEGCQTWWKKTEFWHVELRKCLLTIVDLHHSHHV